MMPALCHLPKSGQKRHVHRPLAAVAAILLVLIVLAGCRAVGAEQQRTYDDPARIARQGDSYSFGNRVGNSSATALAITFGSFNGKQTVWTIDAPAAATVDLDVDAKLAGGRFKVCLIDPSRTVSTIFEGNRKDRIALAVPKGRSDLAIVGRDARGELTIAWTNLAGIQIRRIDSD